ncbi:MAG: 50S ribosomal protein L13 [Theionarchaea archaeon]|nr:MAG: 50S ribosomal protein L13 [Theionarchaea archaeon DG-70-1]MBU7028179.1 50S ribosomal protein L13 [Theionarchaea archaeon]
MIIDAENLIMGRMASFAAKKLMEGEEVIIINAEKAVITGKKEYIFRRYKQRIDRADLANPRKGPQFPRTPEGIVKRAVRGMVPFRKHKGREALKKLRVFRGAPEKYKKGEDVPCDNILERTSSYVKVGDISRFLGYEYEVVR